MEPIILASASPRRKELLEQVHIPFIVKPSGVDEGAVELSGTPEEKAERLAFLKAEDVAKVISSGLVLGADTIVVIDDDIFGKPQSREDAYKMIERMSGREHLVMTGIALIDSATGRTSSGCEVTRVRFAKLAHEAIRYYIDTGEPEGKAGAYALQGLGALLVEEIKGCYANVVGLPLMRLRKMLEEFGVFPLSGNC